jgi:hypothetical protein
VTRYYCQHGLTTGANDGSSWENAFRSLTACFPTSLSAGDELWVKEHSGITWSSTVTLSSTRAGITLHGGFATSLTGTNGTVGASQTGTTIINAGSSGSTIFCYTNSAMGDVECSHFTFNNFRYVWEGRYDYGHSKLTCSDSVYYNCNVPFVMCWSTSDSYLEITDCLLDTGIMAVTLRNAHATITDTIIRNYTYGGGAYGYFAATGGSGGIFAWRSSGASLTMDGCTVYNCVNDDPTQNGSGGVVTWAGGAINSIAPVTITNCEFYNCESTNGAGGALFLRNSSTITDSYFHDNTAYSTGGAIHYAAIVGSLTTQYEKLKIIDNIATTSGGGGIYHSGDNSSVSYIRNCIIAQNTCDTYGGGLMLEANDNTLSVVNNTIADNVSISGNVGGIYQATNDFANIINCILWGNTGLSSNIQLYNPTTYISSTHANIYNCDIENINSDGLYLGLNGFVTDDCIDEDPRFYNRGNDPYQLGEETLCVDGAISTPTSYPSTDYFGNARINEPDMGAYEWGYLTPITPTLLRFSTLQLISEPVPITETVTGFEDPYIEDPPEGTSIPYGDGELLVRTRLDIDYEKDNKPKGWLYDIKRWGSVFDVKLPTLPRLMDQDTTGLAESIYFRSGVGEISTGDLYIKSISEFIEDNKKVWLPIVKNGFYYRYQTEFFYYSDDSIVQNINRDNNIDGRCYLELNSTPRIMTPILAASFTRNPTTYAINYLHKFNQKTSFTGLYSGGEEQETVTDAGRILWDNVDITKREFIIDQTISGLTRLFFNRDYNVQIGVDVSEYADIEACEYIGTSTGSGHEIFLSDDFVVHAQLYYLRNFPVSPANFKLYVYNNSTYTEWIRANSWWDMVLSSQSNQYYLDEDLGIVHIASTSVSGLPVIDYNLAVRYNLTLRVEYEDSYDNENIIAFNSNISPVTQSLNQGFVCITHENLDAANIVLTINKPRITSTGRALYGPISIGSDYASLKANVTSASGVNLSNIPLTFTMAPTTVGYLNGGISASAITDSNGNAFSNYQPPVSADSIGYYSTICRACTNPSYSSYREIVISQQDLNLTGQEEYIYLYQILKDDILLGYKTVDQYLASIYYENTPAWVVDATTYARWKEEMILKYDLRDFVEPTSENVPVAGRKVIVYQISGVDNNDPTAIYPTTGLTGAVVPVKPILVEEISGVGDGTDGFWRLIYPAGAIPACGETEDIAAYWIVSHKYIDFQAHCWSPYYNREIYSNIIRAKVILPDYMLGEYINALSQKIPFGWKLVSENDNIASGLDGATFITINPYSGPYEILDLVGGTGSTEEWASAPFRTVGFQFYISS